MNLNANLRLRVNVDHITHVRRDLVGRGNITVSLHQEVSPETVLGVSTINGGFFSVPIAKALGVLPAGGEKYLQHPVGTNVYKGELLALKRNFMRQKLALSPIDGVVSQYDPVKGELLLKYLTRQSPLTSGVHGIVDFIDQDLGYVLIKTMVTEIYGMFGCGNQRMGIINVLNNPGVILAQDQVSRALEKQIIVAGALVYGSTLRKAIESEVSGIIVGGINARDFRAMMGTWDVAKRTGKDFGLSLVVTEGFGPLMMGTDIHERLKMHNGRFAFINGNTNRVLLPSTDPDSIMSLRKVALAIPKGPQADPYITVSDMVLGKKVRIVWPPFAGWQGKVVAIDQTSTILPSGISTYLITVDMSSRRLRVPYSNVELV